MLLMEMPVVNLDQKDLQTVSSFLGKMIQALLSAGKKDKLIEFLNKASKDSRFLQYEKLLETAKDFVIIVDRRK
jgi:hypothetical protein